MKYPALCPWVELSVDGDGLRIEDTKRNRRFRAISEYEPLLRGLDGRTPPRQLAPGLSAEACAGLLQELKTHHLTRQRPAFSKDFLSLSFTVPLAPATSFTWAFACIFNGVLLKLWLPSVVLAVWAFLSCPVTLLDNHLWLGNIVGLVLGLLLHELAHACACIAYGGRVSACGLMLWCLLPGAFVELDDTSIKHPLKRAQVFAAGVEMNLLLSGFFLLLSGCHPLLGTPCFCAAVNNALLALLNLTLSFGLDGMHILSALLGVENVCSLSLTVLTDRSSRRHLRKMGLSGRAALAFCGLGVSMLLTLPLLLIINLSEVLLWLL